MLRTKIHIALSAIGVFLGLSAFLVFFSYWNFEAGLWGLCSALNASLALALHCHYLNGVLHANFSRRNLQNLGDFGMVGFISGTALTIFYVFLEIYYKTDVLPIQSSIIIKMVWSLMMMKWGLRLYIVTRNYMRTYNDHPLFSEDSNVESI